jgi:hypothetical protein
MRSERNRDLLQKVRYGSTAPPDFEVNRKPADHIRPPPKDTPPNATRNESPLKTTDRGEYEPTKPTGEGTDDQLPEPALAGPSDLCTALCKPAGAELNATCDDDTAAALAFEPASTDDPDAVGNTTPTRPTTTTTAAKTTAHRRPKTRPDSTVRNERRTIPPAIHRPAAHLRSYPRP